MNNFKNINKYTTIFCMLLFGYIFFLTTLFPIHHIHEFIYNQPGNPFVQQYNEFFQWHGRFLTHIVARITLKLGTPLFYIIKSLLICLLFFFSLKTIEPNIHMKKFGIGLILLLSLFLFVNSIFPFTTFMMYYMSDLLNLFGYYIPALFIILYISFYINIFYGKTKICLPCFLLIAFITGSLHEMVIACIPFIITIYILLKIQITEIPKWFWLSLPFFLLGFSILLFAPGSSNRVLDYAKADQWEFFGQTINWLELGYKKYFYSLVRHIFYTADNWYSAPGFLPSTWYIQVLIFLFTFLNYKKYKNMFDMHILLPLLYWLFSWYTCIVMSASPMYHGVPMEFSKFFMYISLTGSAYYYLKEKSVKIQTIFSVLFLLVVLIGQGIQVLPVLKAKKEYLELIEKLDNNKISEARYSPKAKLGNLLIIDFGRYLPNKYTNITFKYTN
ncbi:MAG: DUF6056 family protein [Brevinemataceae bacterium]